MGAPALVDPADPPDRDRQRPGHDEEQHDAVADVLQVDVGDRRQRPARDAGLVGDQPDQLDAADDQRDGDRERGHGDVVVDLADRARERPAVGHGHEGAVEGVQQRHPGREEHRQRQHRPPRQVGRDRAAGDDQQADLGDGVEAEAEQEAGGVHVPRLGDRPGDPPEDAVEEAALVELALELGLVVPAVPHLAEDPDDADEGGEVDQPDRQQEGAADQGAPDAGELLQRGAVVADAPRERPHAQRDAEDHHEDDRGVPEAEPEADAHRALALGHQLAGGVVDGGDVVGVEGVPHAEGVRREAEADAEHLAADVVAVRGDDAHEQAPPEQVQEEHEAQRPDQAGLLARGEAPAGGPVEGGRRHAANSIYLQPMCKKARGG